MTGKIMPLRERDASTIQVAAVGSDPVLCLHAHPGHGRYWSWQAAWHSLFVENEKVRVKWYSSAETCRGPPARSDHADRRTAALPQAVQRDHVPVLLVVLAIRKPQRPLEALLKAHQMVGFQAQLLVHEDVRPAHREVAPRAMPVCRMVRWPA